MKTRGSTLSTVLLVVMITVVIGGVIITFTFSSDTEKELVEETTEVVEEKEYSSALEEEVAAETTEVVEEKEYFIEHLTPKYVRIIALKLRGSFSIYGYGDCFAKAIQELNKKYEIEQITAVNDSWDVPYGAGSLTKELLIRICPKE